MAAAVTQAKIRRGLKALREAGFEHGTVEIAPDGTVRVIVGKGAESEQSDDEIMAMIKEKTDATQAQGRRHDA